VKAVFLGPPGAGKGTYASYFRLKYCIPYIASGDVFREEVAKDSELGRVVKKYIDRGELVPDDIAIEIVLNKLKSIDKSRGFILDGFPRTIPQARALDDFIEIDVAVYIYIPVETAVERLSTRYICPACGRIYNLRYKPPRNDLRCDYDNAELVRRSDDDPLIIRRRYELYYQLTKPVIDYYRDRRILIEVDNSLESRIGIKMLEERLIASKILKLEPCNPSVEPY